MAVSLIVLVGLVLAAGAIFTFMMTGKKGD